MQRQTQSPRRAWLLIVALLSAFALLAAACGDSDSDSESSGSETDSTEAMADGDLSGSIDITGSSTVEPVSNLLAEAFSEQNPDVAISISGPGSGDGHKAACAGEVPIWNSSRQIKDSEAECLADAGIEFIEFRVGIDGISVITSTENDAVECLNFADLYSLVGIESTGAGSWADVNDLNAELGGTGPFPDGGLEIFAPGEESGTFDSFIEIALEDIHDERVESAGADESSAVRPDYNASANDNVIIDGIAGNQFSLGWVGFAFADENRDRVKLIEIDGGGGCTAPTPETIASADFPISRFLYTYVDVAQADDPAIQAFVDFMLSDEGQTFVVEAGYVNLSSADLEQSRSNWANKTTGITFGAEAPVESAAEEAPAESISGEINITGSSTVEPVSNLLAESFAEANPDVAISISGPGSGDGHKAACAGEVPIWNSSRQIKDSEAECLADAGIEFIEFRVGIDGISVITSAENDAIECLNFEDLYSLVGVEATGFGSWADANDLNAAIGGTGPFPDADLEIFAPGEESGTFDSFIEIALEGVWEGRVESGDADDAFAVRPDYNASANDNVIIDGIAGNQFSLGWVGFAFADENRDRVNLIEIDGGDGCVAPTPETIASADFPISRFLYTYVDVAQADDPAIQAFVDFMLSDEGQTFVVEAGYVNLDPADLEQSRSNWANKTTGITF